MLCKYVCVNFRGILVLCNQEGHPLCKDQGDVMELCSMLCGSREGSLGRVDTCVCMAEFPCCSPETITALLIGYIPYQKKKKRPRWLCKATMPQVLRKWYSVGRNDNAALKCIWHPISALWFPSCVSWASGFTSLRLSFLICKVRVNTRLVGLNRMAVNWTTEINDDDVDGDWHLF